MLNLIVLAVLTLSPATPGPEDSKALVRQLGAKYVLTPTVARLEMWVDPLGRVRDCAVRGLVGNEDAGDDMCRFLKRRKLKPAVGQDGKATYGHYFTISGITRGSLDEDASRLVLAALGRPDVMVGVNSLPDGRSEMERTANVQIGPTGEVQACEPAGIQDTYSAIACQQISAASWPVRLDDEEAPTAYVRRLQVRFELSAES